MSNSGYCITSLNGHSVPVFHITDFLYTLLTFTNDSVPNGPENMIASNHAISDKLTIGHGHPHVALNTT